MRRLIADTITTVRRMFTREPWFVLAVIFTVAIAVGANASAYGVVSKLLFAPPPGVAQPSQLVRIAIKRFSEDGESFVQQTMSYPDFRALRSDTRAIETVAISASDTITVGQAPELRRVSALGVSAEYFNTLGATPALGTFFRVADEQRDPVVVLSHAYWKRNFAGDKGVVGAKIFIDQRPFTIAGVARRGFNGEQSGVVDLYVPLAELFANRDGDWQNTAAMHIVTATARLRDGANAKIAAELLSGRLRGASITPESSRPPQVELTAVMPGKEVRESQQGRIALWLSAMSAIVLLIAAANVGTLLSIRAARQEREHSVRVALGAGLGRLAQQVLLESVMLAAVGAIAGVILSMWFTAVIRAKLLPGLALDSIAYDVRVLLETALATCLVAVLAAVAPILKLRRTDIRGALQNGSSHSSTVRPTLQRHLVSVQVGLCAVLLIGAGLFVKSLNRITSQDLGFSTAKLLYATLDFHGYVPGVERDLAYAEGAARVSQIPGVTATVAAGVPFGPHNIPPVSIPGFEFPPSKQIPIMYGATPSYLRMMRVSLKAGRLFTERDTHGSAQVVLVNSTLASTVWPGRSAIGHCMRIGFGPDGLAAQGNPADGAPCREIVGVVSDSRARSLRPDRNEDKLMQYYVPFEQLPDAPFGDQSKAMGLVIEVSGDIDRAAALVSRTLQGAGNRSAFANVKPYQDLIDPQLRSWRLGASLFSAFGVLALAIAAVGLFGVVSYMVAQRTREIGVRLALGGSRVVIAKLVLADTLRVVLIGLAIGIPVALAAGPLLAASLFQTSPHDMMSIGSAIVVLVATGGVAAILPAWRSTRVDPLIALRAES